MCKPFGVTGQDCARSVREKFALAGDGKLDKRRNDRRKNGEHDTNDHKETSKLSSAAVAIPAPMRGSEEKIRNERHKPDEHDNHRRDKHVAIADMRQFVRYHSFKLAFIKNAEQSRRRRNDCMLFVAPGCERVRSGIVNHI